MPAKETSAPTPVVSSSASSSIASIANSLNIADINSQGQRSSPIGHKRINKIECIEGILTHTKLVQTQSTDSVKWIESESVYGEVPQLVPSPGHLHQPRRCCRNSTSSGYSSHSPPPSAASYNPPPPPPPLAVIREGESIPRTAWPYESDSTDDDQNDPKFRNDCDNMSSRQRTSPVSSCSCSCDGGSSSDYGPSSHPLSAREVLLELSRTLSSVLEGDCGKSDDEILRDISRTVAQGQDFQRRSLYEEIYRNSSLSSNSKDSNSTIAVNPINSRLYNQRCYCEGKHFVRQNSVRFSPKVIEHREKCPPTVFLLPDENYSQEEQHQVKNWIPCDCNKKYENIPTPRKPNPPNKILKKQSSSNSQLDVKEEKDSRNEYANAAEHEYTTLECSDESSSSDYVVNEASSTKSGWCQDFRGFDKNLDFTLDGLRAERLGRAIARAKRRRQWCRVFLIILGFVFFILSCVIVSLAVTKGRKAFGSM